MNNRYDNSRIFRDDNGRRYLSRIEYPPIPLRDSDILIRGVFGQTFMNLANQYYGDPSLWWFIAKANNLKFNTDEIGTTLRIPSSIELAKGE